MNQAASQSDSAGINRVIRHIFDRRGTLLATLATLLLMGCNAVGSDDDNGQEEFWGPFNSQSYWEIGDGRLLVELSGFERGHDPGKRAEFTVNIENRREQRAELELCALLIDEEEVVQRFDQFSVSIEPSASRSTSFTAGIDEELEPHAYGLAVVVGDIGAIVHTIRVGLADDEAGPWLDAENLICE